MTPEEFAALFEYEKLEIYKTFTLQLERLEQLTAEVQKQSAALFEINTNVNAALIALHNRVEALEQAPAAQ